MTVKIEDVRLGDELTVRVRVEKIEPHGNAGSSAGRVLIRSSNGATGWYHESEIATRAPAPHVWIKGDLVHVRDDHAGALYRIVLLNEGKAWLVGTRDGTDRIVPIMNLVLFKAAE